MQSSKNDVTSIQHISARISYGKKGSKGATQKSVMPELAF